MLYSKQFKWQDELIHNVGLSFFKKDWVIKEIVYHPLKFAKRRMEDPDDTRPIRIRYFAAFVMKNAKNKQRVAKYKEVYRQYDKYKDIVPEFGCRNDTLEHYQYDIQGIGIKNIWVIDKIYAKGSVINEQQQEMKQI
jgi:hypothetical protein